ncbi:MAG: DnaJ domain-containing protein [Pseudomonadota bacterium]|nr:DnaJ domain-containing protein [Pseudomonadota bacterium]
MSDPLDPKGYYAVLGLAPGASFAEIKRAFRKRAKELHPDINIKEGAKIEFQALYDAYQHLFDPAYRAAYDRKSTRTPVPERADLAPDWIFKADKPSRAARPRHARSTGPAPCASCGCVTPDVKFASYTMVIGLGLTTLKKPIEGLWCRRCSDLRALKASIITWILGWWSIPMGPIHTVRALVCNMRGGMALDQENAILLGKQAAAFVACGKLDAARRALAQALVMTDDPMISSKMGEFWRTIGGGRSPRFYLRTGNFFTRPAFYLQLLPFFLMAAFLGAFTLGWFQARGLAPLFHQMDNVRFGKILSQTYNPAIERQLYHVATTDAVLKVGPGSDYPTDTRLERFTTLHQDQKAAGGQWVRVRTEAGRYGWLPTDSLGKGSGSTGLMNWCRSDPGPVPERATILMQSVNGDATLTLTNSANRPLIVQLRGENGECATGAFLPATTDPLTLNLPQGAWRAELAMGADFAIKCGLFATDMNSITLPESVQVPDTQTLTIDTDLLAKGVDLDIQDFLSPLR